MASATDLDNILVFTTRDYISGRPANIIERVLLHATAAAMFPQFVNSATGRISEGITTPTHEDDEVFNVFKASSLAIPAELIRTLLGLHAQELDYERLNQYAHVEGYADWLSEWRAAKRAAIAYLQL